MKRYAFLLPLVLLGLSSIMLQACQSSGGGYSRTTWEYTPPPMPAQSGPNALGKTEDMNSETLYQNPLRDSSVPNQDGTLPYGTPGSEQISMPDSAPNVAMRPQYPVTKVALLLPLSGQNEKLGQSMLNGAQIALFDVGHSGLELIPLDTKGTAQGARAAAKSAIDGGAQLVLGPVFRESVQAAKPIIRRANLNMIAFTTDWSLADSSTFIMGFLPFDQIERIVAYSAKKGIANIGVMAPTNSYGSAVLNAYENLSPLYNINTSGVMRFSEGQSGMANKVRNFAKYDSREDNPDAPLPFDAIFMPVGGNSARSLASLASQYDLRPQDVRRLGTGLLDDARLATEPSMDGAWFAAPPPGARTAFEKKYFDVYGISALRLATLAYDSTALAAILSRTGYDRMSAPAFYADNIMNPNGFAGVDGIFRFRENGLVERGLAVLEYRHGNIVVLEDAPNTFLNGRRF